MRASLQRLSDGLLLSVAANSLPQRGSARIGDRQRWERFTDRGQKKSAWNSLIATEWVTPGGKALWVHNPSLPWCSSLGRRHPTCKLCSAGGQRISVTGVG